MTTKKDPQRAKELLEKEPKDQPASDELCSALGIDPDEVVDLIPPRTHTRTAPRYEPYSAGSDPTEPLDASDPIAACLRTFVEYMADRDRKWWLMPYESRKREVDFVRHSLLDLYHDLTGSNHDY